uniref:Uncharacterized protein n=1 Tax=Anguilla anguilla TaxID=7936 RepID=A0A0E9RL32_ANGAN
MLQIQINFQYMPKGFFPMVSNIFSSITCTTYTVK